MINKTYLEATKNWKALIDLKETDKITKFLNSGTFTITKEEYNSFDKNSKFLYYYYGVMDTELYVFIIDSENDLKKDHSKVLIKKITYGIDASSLVDVKNDEEPEMDTKEFLQRLFNWNLISYNWIESKLKSDSLFEGIKNPMDDLNTIFKDKEGKDTDVKSVYHFFGLHLPDINNNNNTKLKVEIESDFSKYEIDLFCFYACRKDKGKEQANEWSVEIFSEKDRNEDKKITYSLFGDR